MEKTTEIKNYIEESIDVKKKVLELLPETINEAAKVLKNCLKLGNKIMVAGNGGSAADAQHWSAELLGRYKKERKALPCIALTTDTSMLTAWSNDYTFETVFARQIEALGKQDDIFIAISTSGNSKNLIEAAKKCKELGIKTIGLLGNEGGKLKEVVDLPIIVPSDNTPRIQESHIMIIHILCELIEKELFEK